MAFFYKWWLRPNLLTRYPSHRIVLQVDIQIWLVVEPTHLNNIRQNGFIFPKFRGEHKNYFTSSDPNHDMLGGGCQVMVVI